MEKRESNLVINIRHGERQIDSALDMHLEEYCDVNRESYRKKPHFDIKKETQLPSFLRVGKETSDNASKSQKSIHGIRREF